jgi:hypothetical protein
MACGVKRADKAQAGAGVQGPQQHRGQAVDVRDRQHAVGEVARRQAAQAARDGGHEQQVAVAEHHALGIAGGAGGVDQRRGGCAAPARVRSTVGTQASAHAARHARAHACAPACARACAAASGEAAAVYSSTRAPQWLRIAASSGSSGARSR